MERSANCIHKVFQLLEERRYGEVLVHAANFRQRQTLLNAIRNLIIIDTFEKNNGIAKQNLRFRFRQRAIRQRRGSSRAAGSDWSHTHRAYPHSDHAAPKQLGF